MSSPPVVDHVKRNLIQDIKSKSLFNVFNIVAVLAILVIGYFLYKKFTEKFQKGSINIPDIMPLVTKVQVAPVMVETTPDAPEAIPEPGTKEG